MEQVTHQGGVCAIHDKFSNAPVLCYYDMGKDVTIQADASQTGLGAALMQEGQPIYYASRAMMETEQNYAQIEKELLAILLKPYLLFQDELLVEDGLIFKVDRLVIPI